MYYIAVFKDREISDKYRSEEKLKQCNEFRWHNVYRVLALAPEVDMNQIVKETLREIPRVRR